MKENAMPGVFSPVADERHGLLTALGQQRYVLGLTAFGLSDDQARATPSASELSVGGLIRHLDRVERNWMDIVLQRQAPFDPTTDWSENFRFGPGDSLRGVLDEYEETCAATDAVIGGIADLGQAVPVPRDSPWFPKDVDAWSVRWVLLHLITETARHAGHADIIRESIDGATGFSIMAAAENWPASPWITPWTPAD
jgi:hypothetical protein